MVHNTIHESSQNLEEDFESVQRSVDTGSLTGTSKELTTGCTIRIQAGYLPCLRKQGIPSCLSRISLLDCLSSLTGQPWIGDLHPQKTAHLQLSFMKGAGDVVPLWTKTLISPDYWLARVDGSCSPKHPGRHHVCCPCLSNKNLPWTK